VSVPEAFPASQISIFAPSQNHDQSLASVSPVISTSPPENHCLDPADRRVSHARITEKEKAALMLLMLADSTPPSAAFKQLRLRASNTEQAPRLRLARRVLAVGSLIRALILISQRH
jgi:hypothetical protein